MIPKYDISDLKFSCFWFGINWTLITFKLLFICRENLCRKLAANVVLNFKSSPFSMLDNSVINLSVTELKSISSQFLENEITRKIKSQKKKVWSFISIFCPHREFDFGRQIIMYVGYFWQRYTYQYMWFCNNWTQNLNYWCYTAITFLLWHQTFFLVKILWEHF